MFDSDEGPGRYPPDMSDSRHLDGGRLIQLVEAAATVAGQPDLMTVLRSTIETAMELTGAEYGALGVIGEHGTLIDFLHAGLDPGAAEKMGRPPEGRGLLGTITRMGKTIRLDDMAEHPDSVGFPENHPGMETFLGVPVRVGERIFGNLYLTEKQGGFTSEDEQLVEALALIAGSAVSSARLHERLHRAAVVEDRERIAREIHDGVIQNLFAIGLSLQAASSEADEHPEEVQAKIADAVTQLDSVMATLRHYIFDLRVRAFEPKNFEAEIRLAANGILESSSAAAIVEVSGDTDDLSTVLIEDVVQLVREGVSNAGRHSGAETVGITVHRRGDWVSIEIRDNGYGFDPEVDGPGMGLKNMRQRVERAGGQIEIRTALGAGTVVRVEMPVR
jgi:signal transduction histidine kinase